MSLPTTLVGYAMTCRCVTCGAPPGRLCDAPRRAAQVAVTAERLTAAGLPPVDLAENLIRMTHARRQDCGAARRRRCSRLSTDGALWTDGYDDTDRRALWTDVERETVPSARPDVTPDPMNGA